MVIKSATTEKEVQAEIDRLGLKPIVEPDTKPVDIVPAGKVGL